MKLNKYQLLTGRTNKRWDCEKVSAAHLVLGIVGEIQEVIEVNLEDTDEVYNECGDVMWYTSELANIFNISLKPISGNYNLNKSIAWIAENVKKWLAYNKAIDEGTLEDCLNNIVFGIETTLSYLNLTLEECCQRNIDKLIKRFPERFDENLAISKNELKINQ